jgi:hypothetical protein
MQLAGLKRKTQRFTLAQQMRLTNDFVDVLWAQPLGERSGRLIRGK